jgi:hypothetical protein
VRRQDREWLRPRFRRLLLRERSELVFGRIRQLFFRVVLRSAGRELFLRRSVLVFGDELVFGRRADSDTGPNDGLLLAQQGPRHLVHRGTGDRPGPDLSEHAPVLRPVPTVGSDDARDRVELLRDDPSGRSRRRTLRRAHRAVARMSVDG